MAFRLLTRASLLLLAWVSSAASARSLGLWGVEAGMGIQQVRAALEGRSVRVGDADALTLFTGLKVSNGNEFLVTFGFDPGNKLLHRVTFKVMPNRSPSPDAEWLGGLMRKYGAPLSRRKVGSASQEVYCHDAEAVVIATYAGKESSLVYSAAPNDLLPCKGQEDPQFPPVAYAFDPSGEAAPTPLAIQDVLWAMQQGQTSEVPLQPERVRISATSAPDSQGLSRTDGTFRSPTDFISIAHAFTVYWNVRGLRCISIDRGSCRDPVPIMTAVDTLAGRAVAAIAQEAESRRLATRTHIALPSHQAECLRTTRESVVPERPCLSWRVPPPGSVFSPSCLQWGPAAASTGYSLVNACDRPLRVNVICRNQVEHAQVQVLARGSASVGSLLEGCSFEVPVPTTPPGR